MNVENTGTNDESQVSGKFAMIPNEILGMLGKNVRTPAGTVERIDGDDLAWWGFFFTFRYQKKPCYQNRNTISDRFDCDVKTVTRRTARLERLGLLTIEQRKGISSIYTAVTVEEFLAMKTREKVTPKTEEKKENGKSDEKVEPLAPQAEFTDQNPDLAVGSAPDAFKQRSVVESDPERGSDAGTDGNHAVSQEAQEDDPTFPPKKPASDYAPWQGMAFEGDGRLSEAAYKWALNAGATDWRHACRLVWEKVGVTPPDEINEDRKPKFLMQRTNGE